MNSLLHTLHAPWVLGCVLLLSACGGGDQPADGADAPAQEVSIDDANNAIGQGLLKLDREIFSLPSPVQTAILLQKNAVKYNEGLVNAVNAESSYLNRTQKALNMGVYGADLAYLSNFNNTQMKNDYLRVVEKIATDMDIRNHIDQSLIDRFALNIDNRDSIYSLNAELFNSVDRYLKESGESHIAALILTGGWVEGMHITLGSAVSNAEIRNRVGEQASAARSLRKLIMRMEDPALKELETMLSDLDKSFQSLGFNYTYVKPITDASERVTYLNSKSSVTMSDEQLKEITERVNAIREYIIR